MKLRSLLLYGIICASVLNTNCGTVHLSPAQTAKWDTQKATTKISTLTANAYAGWQDRSSGGGFTPTVDERGFEIASVVSSTQYGNMIHRSGQRRMIHYNDIERVETQYDWVMGGCGVLCALFWNPAVTKPVVVLKDGEHISFGGIVGKDDIVWWFLPMWLFNPGRFVAKSDQAAEAIEYMRLQSENPKR